jgi:glycosyltransferase involved in cell wall biosynthesis
VDCAAYGFTLTGRDSIPFDLDPITEQCATNVIFVNPRELIDNDPLLPPSATAGSYQIGHWAWELPVFPTDWVRAFETVDEVWVGSKFVFDAVQAATRKPVKITGYAVPDWIHQSKQAARTALGLPLNGFLFLTAFDFASYTRRKNPAAVISAFQDAFPINDLSSPQLILKYHGSPRSTEDRTFFQKANSASRILSFNAVFTEDQMCTLIDACDCFISLHRSEGFALNIAQCMLAGMPVVATGYSGNMQFMHVGNSYPIGYRIVPLKWGEYLCWKGQSWAEPRHDEAVDTIRSVFLESGEAERRGQQARREMLREYSLQAVGQRMKSLLSANSSSR